MPHFIVAMTLVQKYLKLCITIKLLQVTTWLLNMQTCFASHPLQQSVVLYMFIISYASESEGYPGNIFHHIFIFRDMALEWKNGSVILFGDNAFIPMLKLIKKLICQIFNTIAG